MASLRTQLQGVENRLADSPKDAGAVTAAKALETKLMALALDLNQYHAEASEEMLNYPIELNSKLGYLANSINSADAAPTRQQDAVFGLYQQRLNHDLAQWHAQTGGDPAGLNRQLQQAGYTGVFVTPAKAADAIAKGE